jgi:CheY-like chemotaxis protein
MQVDRMASAGLLAAGIGHEINNPLSFVSGNVDLALRTAADLGSYLSDLPPHRLDSDAMEALVHVETTLREMQEALSDARQGARRIQAIARDLATFSRPERTEGAVEIERVLDATLHLCWPEIRQHARVTKRYSGGTIVIANEAQLGQIFLNLISNAAHAIPPGEPERNEISVRVHSDGDSVTIEVSDSGSGITEAHMPRIFDPFFTTKRLGQGTGLGLSIVRNLVTGFGGEVDARSRPGATTVRVRLPLSHPTANVTPSTVTPLGTITRPMSILVVDDEPLIGRVVTRCLGRGHHVEFVSSGKEALARLESDRYYDVVFLDVMMPEMTGIDVYRALETSAPQRLSRIAFLTGGAFTAESREFLETSNVRWLSKPFEARTIRGLADEIGAVRLTREGPRDPEPKS